MRSLAFSKLFFADEQYLGNDNLDDQEESEEILTEVAMSGNFLLSEVKMLQQQIRELTSSQQKFRQILIDLRSVYLSQNSKETTMQIYRFL
ncbi:MAG: hypothetical protein ACK451_06205 [Pseudanabaena sp.]